MVFYWHGTGSSAAEGMSGAIRDGVVQEGGVLVSFQGMGSGGDISRSGTAIFDMTYYDAADQLYACAVRDRNVDPRRVYTTGCSAGGLMATSMAVDRSGYVAAAGPNSGGMIAVTGGSATVAATASGLPWQNDHTPALMTVHGANDMVLVNFVTTSRDADNIFKLRGGFSIDCNTGGGHCGGAALFPAVWQFFKAHPFGVDPWPWAGGLPAGFPSQCKIY
jgi:poly(3-hydroxybutyrate) depolymerase